MARHLHILHFNDVYEITESSREPVGGAPRFQTKVKELKNEFSPLVVFSGDAFSPSVTSSITGGKHMIPVLNEIGIDIATLGNHDFDFGVDACESLTSATNFPWMMANVVDGKGNLFVKAIPSKLMEINGIKVGLIGLVEREWMETVTCFPKDIQYIDQAKKGTELAKELREQGAELVIAVTHSRADNDMYLANHAEGIDIILGGHDHDYYLHHVNGIPILNSGSNFKQTTLIKVLFEPSNDPSSITGEVTLNENDMNWEIQGKQVKFELQRFDITSDIKPDDNMSDIINEVSQEMDKLKQKPLGCTESIWDARAEIVRTQESAVGNFVADLMREYYSCDMALLQGGGIRSNDQYGPGKITMGDAMKMFPFIDCTVVFEISGKYIREALENGFSQWPKHEGRFPQLSGCWVEVDMNNEPGNRVLSVEMGSVDSKEPLEDEKLYSVASKAYAMNGGDGFTSFLRRTRVLVEEENGMTSANLVRNEFLLNKVAYALNRQTRVDNIVGSAINAFKVSIKRSSNIPISENRDKCINIDTEGRIKFIQ